MVEVGVMRITVNSLIKLSESIAAARNMGQLSIHFNHGDPHTNKSNTLEMPVVCFGAAASIRD